MQKLDTIILQKPPVLRAWAAVGGKKESEGPLAECFDALQEDNHLGEESWERAESRLQQQALTLCLKKAQTTWEEVSLVLGGDLQCQCTATNYALRDIDVPFAGLYGACSTMAEGVGLAACLAGAAHTRNVMAVASSHFCTAERQYRTPLEYGGQRTPTSQWTATAAGAVLLSPAGRGPRVQAVTFGRIRDYEISDINNMGAAMAPAAASTILRHLEAMGTSPEDYDAIVTGDLAQVGSDLLLQLLEGEGLQVKNHRDCGLLLYDREHQRVKAGASGAGCSASVLCTHFLPGLAKGRYRRILFLSTGALMSQTTFLQGETIPGIAHAIELIGEDAE